MTARAVPKMLSATLPNGALSNQLGATVERVRVLMLCPVVRPPRPARGGRACGPVTAAVTASPVVLNLVGLALIRPMSVA